MPLHFLFSGLYKLLQENFFDCLQQAQSDSYVEQCHIELCQVLPPEHKQDLVF